MYISNVQREQAMSITQIDIDDQALSEAMQLMGTTTKKETVNIALREYAQRMRRLQAADKLAARAARGEFDRAAAAHEAMKAAQREALG
jgi:Arc/MetJ family transcription regulator